MTAPTSGVRTVAWVSAVALLSALGGIVPADASARIGAFESFPSGNVIAGTGQGTLEEYQPDGTLVATSSPGPLTEFVTGSVVGPDGKLYVTNFSGGTVEVFDSALNHLETFATGFVHPESIVLTGSGNFLVGDADSGGVITELDPSGAIVAHFSVVTEDRGADWLDLAADQCTVSYTSEGTSVKRFNICLDQQLSDLANGLPGPYAYANRLLPDGGLLVADTDRVVRLDSAGDVIQTYGLGLAGDFFALNRDPDGLTFWTADLDTGTVFRFDMLTGEELTHFSAGAGTGVDGLTVVGEPTVGSATHYVALGDSYSSGEGVPPLHGRCHRSELAYPELLGPHLTLDAFLACTGDPTKKIIKEQIKVMPTNAEVVTLTAGGDDLNFPRIVKDCVGPNNCADDFGPSVIQPELARLRDVSLPNLFSAIRSRAGSAMIFIAGYPQILPNPSKVNLNKCPVAHKGFITRDEANFARSLVAEIDSAIRDAAIASGVTYVNPNPQFKGHELCTQDEYFNGIVFKHLDWTYHPNASGQSAYSEAFFRYVS